MYWCISFNTQLRPQISLPKLLDSMCGLCLLFGHKQPFKVRKSCGYAFVSVETANALSKYQLVKSNVLALKGDGR